MTQTLRYGKSSTLRIDVPHASLVADCRCVAGDRLTTPAAAVADALAKPIGYPPLARAVVPGDHVTIAVDPDMPRVPEVVAGVIGTLVEAHVEVANIVVLQTRARAAGQSLTKRLPAEFRGVALAAHDPDDKGALSYLAASKEAEPIYLNRNLCEADVIVPLNLLRPRAALGYLGVHGGLYPTFSDAATQKRFRKPTSVLQTTGQRRRRDEADEVAWLLGLQLTVQVIAGPGDSLLHVLAGTTDEVAEAGQAMAEQAWSREVPGKAELVVAGIDGGARDQTWQNFGRALHAAAQVCAEHGTIILCTELSRRPGPAMRRLAHCDDDARLLHQLQRDQSADAVSAALLLETLEHQHVFLLSKLDEQVVEGMGIGFIGTPEQIDLLGRRCDSCILLADAHRAAPRAAGESR